MPDVALQVNGQFFRGWESIRITRGIESIAGSFALSVSDRWEGVTSWQIAEEDKCTVIVDGAVFITGYVDVRDLEYDATGHTLGVSGRDKAGSLVDCSAVLKSWEFKNLPILGLAQRLAEPFGVNVTMDPNVDATLVSLHTGKRAGHVSAGNSGKRSGLGVPKAPRKFTVDPGESAFEVLDRACRMAGLLPVSDGQGNIVLTRAGTARCHTALIQGKNILRAKARFDSVARYATYIVKGQRQAADDDYGASAAFVTAQASDANVRRTERVLLIRPEGNATTESAKNRAGWEAKVRAARGDSVEITVQDWVQGSGIPWPVNALVHVESDMIGVKGDMLITEATYNIDESSGTTTRLTLKRPDAFIPEPIVSTASTAAWKEIAKGV